MLEVPVQMTCGQLVQSISRCDVHGRVAERDVGVTDVGCVHGESDHSVRHRGIEHAAFFQRARSHLEEDRKSTRLNSSHGYISYAVFCLKKKKTNVCYRHN